MGEIRASQAKFRQPKDAYLDTTAFSRILQKQDVADRFIDVVHSEGWRVVVPMAVLDEFACSKPEHAAKDLAVLARIRRQIGRGNLQLSRGFREIALKELDGDIGADSALLPIERQHDFWELLEYPQHLRRILDKTHADVQADMLTKEGLAKADLELRSKVQAEMEANALWREYQAFKGIDERSDWVDGQLTKVSSFGPRLKDLLKAPERYPITFAWVNFAQLNAFITCLADKHRDSIGWARKNTRNAWYDIGIASAVIYGGILVTCDREQCGKVNLLRDRGVLPIGARLLVDVTAVPTACDSLR